MLSLAVALAVSAAPIKLAAPGLLGVRVTKEVAGFYSDHLAQELEAQGLTVMTASQINALLSHEQQKALVGCANEGGSCMAELANALGVDGVVTGSIGQFDGLFQINVKIVASSDGRKLGIYSGTAGDQGEVLSALKTASASLHDQVLQSMGRAPKPSGGGGARAFWWAPAAGGVVAIGVGVLMLGLTSGNVQALRTASAGTSVATAQGWRDAGYTERTIGYVLFGVGGAALLAAGALALFGGGSVGATAMVAPDGAGFALAGRLP